MRPRAVLAALAALAAIGLTGCAGKAAVAAAGDQSSRYVAGDGSVRVLSPAQRPSVTDVRGTTLAGAPFDLADLRGKVVVVNFFGSWCTPCIAEADGLEAAWERTRGLGVQFVGVAVKEYSRANVRTFVRAHHIGYPVLYDQPALLSLHFRGLPPNAVPTTVVLDRHGREAARVSGATTYTRLTALVEQVAKEPA